jgi:hypothetical protein
MFHIFNIGTKSGIWAVDTVLMYSAAYVTAIDLKPPRSIVDGALASFTYETVDVEE